MDWNEYKALCDTPDICSRWMLLQTLELLDDLALAARLRRLLAGRPLEKPLDHQGGAATDMLPVDLTLVEAAAVRRQVERAACRGAVTSGTRRRGLGGFVEAWQELETHLANVPSGDERESGCSGGF
ncbi:MAG: hypothetical protein ACODAC_03800 [Pseudomonadota bacterium]